MELIIHDFELPLLHPFTISRETITVQPSVIVELREGDISGYGEATTNSYYGATKERLRESLETCRDLVENVAWEEPHQLWELAHCRAVGAVAHAPRSRLVRCRAAGGVGAWRPGALVPLFARQLG